MANFVNFNDLIERVKIAQLDDNELNAFMEKTTYIKLDNLRIIRFQRWLYDDELRKFILEEAHHFKFSIHLGVTKMYQDLKCTYL